MKYSVRWKRWSAVILAFAMVCQIAVAFPNTQVYADPAVTALEWKDQDRNYRQKISFNHAVGEEDLNGFPVAIRITPSTINYAVTSEQDLKFYNHDQTVELPYEVEKWNPGDESIVWVKVPVIHGASQDDYIWMYYGGSTVKTAKQTDVWDPNFLLVYHFGERIEDYYSKPDLVKKYADSTSNNNQGLRQTSGTSGPSYTLEAKDPRYNMVGRYYESHRGYVRSTNGNIGDGKSQFSLSTWVRPNEYELNSLNYYVIARNRSSDASNQSYFIRISGGKWTANLFTNDADPNKNGKAAGSELNGGQATAEWTYFSLTYDKNVATNNLKLYRNGELVASATRNGDLITTTGSNTTPFTVSKSSDAGSAGGGYRGGVDEIRASQVARSSAWVKAEYENMRKDSDFVTMGPTETRGALQLTVTQPKQGVTYYTPDLSISGLMNEASVVRYRLDGGEPVEASIGSDKFETVLQGLKSGMHTLRVDAVSEANPSEQVGKTITFNISGERIGPSVVAQNANGTIVGRGSEVPLRVKAQSPTGDKVDVSFYEKQVQFVKDYSTKSSGDAAYDRTNTMDPPSNATITSETPLSPEAYQQMAASDDSYYSSKSLSNYPYQRFDMKVDGDLSNVNSLEVIWEGHSTEKVLLYAWNYSSKSWVQLAAREGTAENEDFQLVGILNKTTMVDSTTKIAKLYVASTQKDTMLPGQKPAPADYDFSFIWMTDTQLQAESFPTVYDDMTRWIAANKDEQKIQYVVHTGDIVNNAASETQWKNADRSMKILEDAGIPYGIEQGNHDLNNYYFQYFGENRFKDKPSYGESYENNRNHYDLISAGGVDFIILYMGWNGMNTDSIKWANQVLQQYKDRKAILAVHEYLLYDKGTYGTDNYGGKKIMEQIVQPNSNVYMVLSGHHQSAYYNVKRIGGKVVYELLHDYQDAALGGAAYMRMMYFDMKKQLIYMVPYSPITNDNYGFFQPKHETYTMQMQWNNEPIELATGYIGIQGSNVNLLGVRPATDTGDAEFVWQEREVNKPYTWYSTAQDAYGHQVNTEERTFTLAEPVIQSIKLNGLAPMKVGDQQQSVVEATYTDGTILPLEDYVLSSSNPAVASVQEDGRVMAVSEGETVISAQWGDLTSSYLLTVQANPITEPTMQQIQLSGLQPAWVGEKLQTVVTATYSDDSQKVLLDAGGLYLPGLVLKSSNPQTVEVDAMTGIVTALAKGETVVTATYQNLSSSYKLLVEADPGEENALKGILLEGNATLKLGEKSKVKVTGLYGEQKKPIQEGVQFTSSHEQVATIDEYGIVTAMKKGKATLTARYQGFTADLMLEVLTDSTPGPDPNPGPGPGPGGAGTTPVTPPTGAGKTDDQFIQTVSPDQLQYAQDKKFATVHVKKEMVQVEVPYAAAEQMEAPQIQFQFDWGMVRVDVKSFYTAGQSLNDQQKKQPAFTIAHHAWEDELLDVLTNLQNEKSIDIQPVSPMMALKWSDISGSKDKSTEIHLPLKEKAKGKRLGLYRFGDDGDVQFVSRNLSLHASEAVFRSRGTGKYIVMEYNVDYPDMKNHWASSTIGDLAAQHLFQEMVGEPLRLEEGQDGQGFKPNKAITRAEFAALLARAAGVSPSAGRKFKDVVDTAWYADELAGAVAAGIVQGVGEEKFNPDGLVTREQMAAMLMRAWSVQHSEPLTAKPSLPFQDAKAMGAWSKPFIADAVSLGLLKGRANQMFVPAGTTTRAEAAQAIYNLMFSRN